MKSIRRYLVIILLAAISMINFIAAYKGYQAGTERAEASFDEQLIDVANIIAHVDSFTDRPEVPGKSIPLIYQIWSYNGLLVHRSKNAPATPIADLSPGFSHANVLNYRWRTFSLADDIHNRWVVVAHRTDLRYSHADKLTVAAILPIVYGLPVAGLIIWIVIGSGLSPIYQLASMLQLKRAEDLSPIKLDHPPEELAPVLQSANQLLQRLSNIIENEKRFAADAAHELRTPVSILKIDLHNLVANHPEISSDAETFKHSLDRLEHLIDQILTLYRLAPDQYIAKFEVIDLYKIAREVIAQQYFLIEKKKQNIELNGESSLIEASRFAIETMLLNLIINANRHAPEGSEIRITVGSRDAKPYVCVEDSGPGIDEENRSKVFGRFYRVYHKSDSEEDTSTGLGLAIVENIVTLHGAEIELGESSFKTGLAVTVTFPKQVT